MKKVTLFTTIAVAFLLVGNACATDKMETKTKEEKKVVKMEMTKEIRDNKAQIHDEMAVCLRSNESVETCRTAMMEKMEKMDMTKEIRDSKAKMHEEMATCLRSNESVKECHKAMIKSCKEMNGEKGRECMYDEENKTMHEKMHG